MSEFQLFDSVVCNITFIRNVWNSKKSEISDGGGVKPILDFSQIFPFFYNGSPQTLVLYKNDFAH